MSCNFVFYRIDCEWGWVDEPTPPNCSQQTYHYSRKITWPLHHSWQKIHIYKCPSHLLGQEKYFLFTSAPGCCFYLVAIIFATLGFPY